MYFSSINSILIYSLKTTNRVEYTFNTLLQEGLGLNVQFTNNIEEFKKTSGPRINYSSLEITDCINIEPHGILFDFGIKDYSVEVSNHQQYFKIFFKRSGKTIPFDVFGAAFWLLSRYEEYLPHKTDNFNRYHYKNGLAYQYNFLEVPLINLWIAEFVKILKASYPGLEMKGRKYNFISTIDIDNAYMYKYKGFVRTIAGYLSDILKRNFKNIKNRTEIILNKKEDPFDCYKFLVETNNEKGVESIYFLLLGDYGRNDKNHSATNLKFQSLIKHLADYSATGIHPSYGSTDNLHQLKVEISRLSNITHRTIQKSRQHFSILKFPQTYNFLLQAGINDDYSMGYTNMNGFRASYCFPFKWYSLDDEFTTSLIIHPFAIAENTLEYFAAKENKNFGQLALPIINEVKKYGGQLISIFHNNTFTEKMKQQYSEFLKEAK